MVPLQFKSELDDDTSFKLKVSAEAGLKLDILLPAMKTFILTNLDDTRRPDDIVYDWMGWVETGEDNLDELSWFESLFPRTLEFKNIVPAYELWQEMSSGWGAEPKDSDVAESEVPAVGDVQQGGLGLDLDGDAVMRD